MRAQAVGEQGREDMFSHMMVGSNDIDRARSFYDALFTAIGAKPEPAPAGAPAKQAPLTSSQ